MPRKRPPRKRTNVIERIERHLPVMKDGECWVTDYKPGPHGYVMIEVDGSCSHTSQSDARMCRRLHRVAWEAHNAEPIPEGMIILHTCDNPACINPEHLVLGTHKENTADMIAKGRAWYQKKEQEAG